MGDRGTSASDNGLGQDRKVYMNSICISTAKSFLYSLKSTGKLQEENFSSYCHSLAPKEVSFGSVAWDSTDNSHSYIDT